MRRVLWPVWLLQPILQNGKAQEAAYLSASNNSGNAGSQQEWNMTKWKFVVVIVAVAVAAVQRWGLGAEHETTPVI